MPKRDIHWTDNANMLMNRRDHYARDAIKVDFAENVERDPVPVDEGQRLFVTPVANHRYSVVWRKEPDRFVVEAVVPAQFSPAKSGKLLKQVQQAVEQESNGYIILTP